MPIDNTKLKQLYDTLKQGGYKKDYNNFRTKFLGNENYPYRQKVFNLLSENGEDYGSTYGEFMQRMQVAKPTAASAAPKQPQQIDTLSTIQSARDTIFNPKAAVQPGGKVAQQAGKTSQTQDDAATKPFDVNQANAFVENMRLQNEVAQRQHQNVNDYLQHTAGQFGKNATQLGFKGQSNLGLPLAAKNQDGAFIDALGREYESETEARLAQTGAQHAREALTEANMQHNDPKNYLLEQKARIEKELNARSSQLEGATDRVPSFATGVAGNAMTQAAARLTDKLQDTKYKALTMQLEKVNQALDTLDEAEHAKASDQWIANSSNWAERAGKGVLSFGAATGRSFKRQASKLSNWDFGFSDLAGGLAIYDAVDKADKGGVEALSPEQRKMLDLYAYNNHIQGENKEHLGWGNTAGTGMAQALPFMLEMALNPASGVGKFAQRKAMQWAVKKYGKEKLKQLAKRYLLAKAGTRIAGDWLGAATMSATTGQARVAADAVQRRIGEVQSDIDNFGRITYGGHKNGVDWGEAFGKAFLSNTIENQTEMAGDYFGIIGKAFSKGGQKALDKIGLGFVNDFMRNVSSTKVAKAVTDFENATHWNGTTGEYLEEVLGNVENALMVGDSTFDAKEDTGVFNVDKNIETFLSVAVMGGFFSAVKTASYTAPKKRALNEMADIGRQIDGMLGNNNAALEQWGTWRNTFINGTDEEKKQTLREVMDNQQLPMGFRVAFLEYTKAAQKYHGIAQAEQKRAEEGTLDPIGQALDQAYEEGYGTTEPTERQKAYRRLNETRAQVAQLLELEEDEDLDEAMGNDPIGYIHTLEEQGFTPEQIQPVMDYANAQATYEGVMQQREDSANEQADAVKREVRQITHRQTGQIQKATLDGGEREVYVLNGKVVLYPDGTGVDKQESDDVLYVQDVQTGELFTIAPNRISELAEATDPQAVIAEREEEIAAAMNQEIEQEEGAASGTAALTEAPEVRIPAPRFSGARVTLDLPNGSSVNGVVLQETDDGVEVQTDSPVNGRFVQVFPTDEFDGMLSSVRDEANNEIWRRGGAEPVEAEEENQNDAAANGQQREMQGNGIPVDAKTGEPVYDAVAPDVAWDAIVQEAEGDEAMAMQVVTDMVADMEAKVQKAKKAKKAKVRAGSSVREKLEAQKKHKRRIEEAEARIEEAEAQLEAWRRIAAVKVERIAAAERAKIEAERIAAAERAKIEAERIAAAERAKIEAADAEGGTGSDAAANDRQTEQPKQGDSTQAAAKEDALKPIGKSIFGNIYDQFKGKVKEAFDFLLEHKSGDLLGVFHREDIGDIDLVWGDKGGGLAHIIDKHINRLNDFSNEDEMMRIIENVINNGAVNKRKSKKDKVVIELDNYFVVIRKNTRDKKGNIVDGNKNWIVTAFDNSKDESKKKKETSSDVTLATPNINQGSRAVASDGVPFTHKDTPENSAVQTSGQENAETSLQSEVTRAEQQTNAEPTEGQKEAGNYKKGRVKVGPFDVVIEQPRGSVRSGVDANGKAWETTMQHTYGYFGGTKGVDGDAIDVFLGNDLDGWDGITVFVVDQYNPDGSFDEHKVMLGFNSQEEAEGAYFANYEADWAKTHRTEVTAVPLADFTEWVKSSKRKTKAFAEYKVAKRNAEIDAHNAQNEQLAEQLFSMAKESETEKDFFDRAASLFEVTGYESDLRDIYNGVKSGEIANARALSFYTNATLKPVKEGVKVKAPKSEQKQKAEAPRLATKNGKAGEKPRKHAAQPGVPAVSTQEATLRDALVDVAQQSGLEVVVDEKAQQVLDEVNGRARTMAFGEEYDYDKYPEGRVEPNIADKYVHIERAKLDHGFANFNEAKEWAKSHIVRTLDNAESGGKGNVKISSTAVNKYLSESAVAKSDSKDVHLAVLKKLPEIIHDSVDVETTPDFKKDENGVRKVGNEINKNVLIHRCYGAVEINGNIYRVKITLKEYKDKNEANKAYSYEATKIELFAGTLANDRKTTTDPGTNNSISVAKLLKDVEMSYRPGVKVLEESAKQRARLREHRVFHGSGAEFSAFDHSHMGEGEGSQSFGWGTYVTSSSAIGKSYAKRSATGIGLKRSELESNISRAKEQLPFVRGEVKEDLEAKIGDWENQLENLDESRHLYTVEIPEDTGNNYLDWYSTLSKEQKDTITKALTRLHVDLTDYERRGFSLDDTIGDIYHFLTIALRHTRKWQDVNASRASSKFLSSLGFTGIKYPAGTIHGGAEKGDMNYVIFNEKDAQITDHIRFFRTPGGEAYGFTVDGKIYLDPRIVTAETPIHEYAHLWADMIRNVNAEAWNDIVGLMKATPIWEEVRGLYPELKTDDEIADEVLAHYSGRRGAERLREAQQQAATETGKSVFERAAAVAAIERVKQALAKFWQSVAELFHIRFTSAEEVADRVLADMLNGVNPNKYIKRKGKGVQKLHLNDKTLAGIHNITEEKLRKALNLGGLANPSLAIIDTAQNKHEDFGEISLIAPSALVDKETGQTAGTWTTDAYTQRYPQVERVMSDVGFKKFNKWVESLDLLDSEKSEIKWQTKEAFESNRELSWELIYLLEKGIDAHAYTSNAPYEWKQTLDAYSSADELLDGMQKDEELHKKVVNYVKGELSKPIKEKIRGQIRQQIKNETGIAPAILPPRYRKQVTEIFNRDYAKDLFGEDLMPGEEDVKKVMQHLFDLHNRTKHVDFSLSKSKASTYVHSHDLYSDYLRWQNKKLKEFGVKGRLFRGYSADGSRKYIPETLKNVSKAMVADANGQTNGGEMVSLGSFVAKFADRVDSADEMRANKNRLATNESKQGFYSEWMPTYKELADELSDDIFAGEQRLHDIAVQDNPVKYAKKEYGITLSKSFMDKLNAFKKAIREDMTSAYFETKFERPVYLNEFAAAVIPSDLSEDVKGGLEKSGIAIYEYDPKIEGDRDRATNAAFEADNRIRFQFVGQQGAAALDKAEEATTRLDNLGVAREMESQQKDAKAIKLATGWERGGDGKWRYEIMDGELKKEPNVKEKVSSDGEVHYETTLGEILDNEELYRSYPELRMLPVSIQQMDGGVSGIYLPSGYMSLSMGLYRHRTQPGDVRREIEQIESTPEYKEYSKYFEGDMPDAYIGREDEWEEAMNEAEAKFFESELGKRYHDLMWGDKRKAYSYGFDEVGKGVILHEVQHAIQHIEGFAMGGNSTTYREHLAGFREKYEAWSVIDEFEDKSKELGDDARPIDVYNALVREYQSLGLEFGDGFAPSREAFDKGFNLWTRGYDNEGYEDAYNEYQRLMGKFGSGEYNNRYDQLAGEVEARNVQKRLYMTPEERRQSLAEETEDVAREDQIFIMDGIESANSLGDSASFDEHQNEDLKAVNERFNEQLGILTEKNADSMVFSLGRPSVVLQSAGVMNKPMKLYGNKVMKKMRKHGFALEELRDLPRAVADPIAVFNNYGEDGNRSILTELRTQQGNFLVTLSTGVDQDVDFNIVRSVFGKGDENVLDWINKGLATYINKEKALSFLSYQSAPIAATAANAGQSSKGLSSASQPVQQEIDKLDTATKVVKDFVNPQLSEENNFREGKGELSDDMLSYLNDPMAQMMGKPRGTKKQRAQFAERERGRMQAHAEKLVERLHLTNVEIVTDVSQLEGKQRTAKGFYNKRTEKITIVLPNHASTADVEQTLLHEAVAHYGLRQLFGEHFDDFLDMVYRNAEEGIRRKIAEASAKHGWNVRTATEEYLADLAERTDFENTSPTWWAKIKGFFLDMLRGLGFEAMDGQTLTDNELRYVLWRSYENLTEPGKYPTFIAEARDVAKQHALQVGQFAPTETTGSRVAENEALSEEEMSEILFRDGSTYNYTQVLARDRYERRIKSGMYQTKEALQDSMLGLRTAMESILEAEGRKGVYIEDIDGFENAYLGENRLSSVNQAEAEKFAREVFAPMLEEVSKLAPTAEERAKLIDYLFAKHGLERNEVMARRAAAKEARKEFEKELRTAERAVAKDPLDLDAEDALDDVKQRMQEREDALYSKNRQTDYAGLTTLTGKAAVADAERMARDMVAAYENAHDTKALWDAINNVTQRTLKKSFDTGMISRDTYDDIRSMYQFYIPLRGFDERTSNEAYSYLGGTESVFTSPIKTAKGRRSKADDPLAYMQMMAESAIAQGNRNQLVKQKLLNFALNHPSDLISVSELWLRRDPITDQWNVVQPGDLPGTDKLEDSDTAEMVSQKMEQFEQAMKQFAAQNPTDFVRQGDRPDIPYRVVNAREMQQHQVMVKRNGKTYVLTINGNPRAAQAVNGLTNPNNDMSGAIGVMARSVESANRWLSSVYTTRNPDFVLTNLARDAGYTNTMVWLKEDSSYAVNFNRNYATRANLVNMIRLYSRLMKGQLDLTDPTEMLFSQFISNGGETGYTAMRDLDAHKTKIKKELKKLSSDPSVRKVWNASFDMLDLFNKAAENSARFAAFITSREAGRTLDRSIYDAKEISVNFNKKGAGAKFLDNYGAQVKNDIRDLSWKNPNLLKLTKDVAIYLTVFSSGVGRSFFAFWNAAIQGSTNFGRVVKRHPKKALTAMAIMFALGLANAMVGASGDDDDDAEEGNGYFDHPSNTRRSNLMLRINGKSWASIPLPVEYRAVYGMGELLGSVMSGKERYTNQELAHEVLCQVSQVLPLDVVGEGSGAFVPTAVKPLYEVVTNESWTGLPIYKQTAYNERDPAYTKAYSNTNKQLVGMSKMLNELSGGDSQKSGWIDVNPAVVEHLGRGYLGGYFNLVDKLVKTGETVVGSREYDPSNLLIVNRFVKSGSERTAYRAINNRYYQIKADSEELIKDYKGYNYETKTGKRDYSQKIAQMNGSPELLSAMAAHEYITEVDKYNKALKSEQDEVLKKRMEKELYELKSAMIHTVDSILDHKQTLRKAE